MDVNNVLCFDVWVMIAELSPSSFIAVRSINNLFREYSNKYMEKYKKLFSIKISVSGLFTTHEYFILPNGRKHGLYSIISPVYLQLTQYTYKNGKKNGLYHCWRINKNLQKSDSDLILRKTYKNGKKHGLYHFWYVRNKILNVECSYFNGKKDGLYRVWNVDGKLQFQLSYKNGKKH